MIWKIWACTEGITEQEQQVILFACHELRKYMSAVTTDSIIVMKGDAHNRDGLVLGVGLHPALQQVKDPALDDAIVIDVQGRGGVITGTNPRSVLIAAYRYLRELGFAFFRPGKQGEKYPLQLQEKDVQINEKASNRQRMICIEGSASFESVMDILDWMPKVGMNGYFTEFFTPMIFFKRWYQHGGYEFSNPCLESRDITPGEVDGIKATLVEEIKKRNLLYMDVGHAWTCVAFDMPALGWEQVSDDEIPEGVEKYFALVDGKRELNNKIPMNTQLCYGNPEVVDKIVDLVIDYCKKNAHVQYVSFWLADGSNVHCECDLCKDTRPSDFYIQIMNQIDARLTAEGLSTKCSFCVYTDLLWPPAKEKLNNPDRFTLMYCPISRTYSKAMTSGGDGNISDYVRNRLEFPTLVEDLQNHLEAWRQVYDGEVMVYDYYFQWDCYKDLGATETARVIHQDIRNYQDMKFSGLVSCQGQRVFSPTSLGMNMMARTLWNRDCDFEAVRDEILENEFGPDFALVKDYLQDLSYYSIPQVTRLEKAVAAEENEALYCKGLRRVEEFMPVIDAHLAAATGAEHTSWRYLKFHSELSCLLMQAFLNINRGAEPVDQWPVIEAFVNEKEWEMREYFDVFEFKYVYGRLFPKLKNMQKTLIIGI